MVHGLVAVQLISDSINLGVNSTHSAADLLHVADQLVEAVFVGARIVLVLVTILGAQTNDLHNESRDGTEHD